MKKKAFVSALIGAVVIIALRVLQFGLFYDYATGFFTDNGMLSIIAIAVCALLILFTGISIKRDKAFFGSYKPAKNAVAGLGALAAGVMLGVSTFNMYNSLKIQEASGIKEISATGLSMRMPFIAVTAVFALFMLIAAGVYFSGSDTFGRIKVLHLVSVVWSLVFILFVFIHYSISVLITENIFIMFTSASIVVAFLQLSKFLSGINPGGSSLRSAVVASSAAAMLSIGYSTSSLIKHVNQPDIKSDVPMELVFIILAAGIYIASSMWSSCYEKVTPEFRSNTGGKRFKKNTSGLT